MNILFVNDSPFNPIVGGLERVTDVLTKELQKRGHSVFYLCAKINPSKSDLLAYEYPAPLYQLPEYGPFDNAKNGAYYKSLQQSLNIDIVINQRGLGGKFNSLLSLTEAKLVSVIHSIPDGDTEIFLNNVIQNTTPPFLQIKKTAKRLTLPILRLYWRKRALLEQKVKYQELAYYSDAIVTLSSKDGTLLQSQIENENLTRIISIPNPNTFKETQVIADKKQRVLLYVGRLTKAEKEPIRLLKIWRHLHNCYPDWQLKIVGDGEAKDSMEKYVATQHLENVVFEGRKSDVAKYYREASFVCLTSNFEGWGMALTEGMQYGCIPCTFNNYGAAFEIIDDGVNGCLIPAFDLKNYADRLSELMSNDQKRIQMAQASIQKVAKFSVENVVDKWEHLFQDIYQI